MNHSKLSRRAFSGLVAGAPFLLKSQPSSLSARVKIDTERTVGKIDPNIYGNFIEHLGRCIQDGIFDEGNKLSDASGFRRDVLSAVKDLHVSLLRWPGGNFSSNYDWMDGIGPRDGRPRRLEMAWHTVEDNRFGTHEFLDYVTQIGADPYICTNLGTGTWNSAQQWVEYCNVSEDTAMTRLRRKNGRAEPWKVTYWGLGNEMDGPWQMGHRSADDYGKFALEAAKLMKWTDPNIKLIAAGSSFYAGDWLGWNRTVLEHLKNHTDYLSLHLYVGNRENQYYDFLASSLEMAEKTKLAEGVIAAAVSNSPRKNKIYIAWDEWNVWYRARGEGKEKGRRILEEHYNLEDALVVASFLNCFLNHAHIVKMANLAQLVNVIAPIFTNENGLYLQTIYYPLQLFAANSKGMALDLFIESPTYSTKQHETVPYLDVSAAFDNGSLVLNIVNRHLDKPIEAVFEAGDKQFAGGFEVAEVNGPEIKSENNFDAAPVKITRKSVNASGRTLRYSFPPHSYTMLKGKLA